MPCWCKGHSWKAAVVLITSVVGLQTCRQTGITSRKRPGIPFMAVTATATQSDSALQQALERD